MFKIAYGGPRKCTTAWREYYSCIIERRRHVVWPPLGAAQHRSCSRPASWPISFAPRVLPSLFGSQICVLPLPTFKSCANVYIVSLCYAPGTRFHRLNQGSAHRAVAPAACTLRRCRADALMFRPGRSKNALEMVSENHNVEPAYDALAPRPAGMEITALHWYERLYYGFSLGILVFPRRRC